MGANAKKFQKPCQKQSLPLDAGGLPSNTRMPGPTPLTTPNSIRIQSAVLPLLTCADRQMGHVKVQ